MPTDQLERMQAQATRIGSANLTHSAQVVSEGLTQMRGATAPRLTLEFTAARILLPVNNDAGVIARIERLERVGSIASLPASAQTPASAPTPTKMADLPRVVVVVATNLKRFQRYPENMDCADCWIGKTAGLWPATTRGFAAGTSTATAPVITFGQSN